MKVKLYWPQCYFLNNELQDEAARIDSFWVECKYWEAEKYVFPYLKYELINKIKLDWKTRDKYKNRCFKGDNICFLISKNLESIMAMPWFYPYSGHWNSYCPFIAIKEIEIKKLKDLSEITNENP